MLGRLIKDYESISHEEKGRIYRKRAKKICNTLWHFLTYTCLHVLHTNNFGETCMCILPPKVSLQFAICMGLHMHCSSHSCTLLITSSRLTYCGNRESSRNKYFARLFYHTQYWVNEWKVRLGMSTGVVPLTAVLTYP